MRRIFKQNFFSLKVKLDGGKEGKKRTRISDQIGNLKLIDLLLSLGVWLFAITL